MEARILRRNKLLPLVDELIKHHQVIAPRDELSYGEIGSASEVYLGEGKPAKSLKEFFFPEREVLFEYQLQGQEVKLVAPPPPAEATRVIFGARPCAAAALAILDKVFAWDYLDSSYLQRRESTIIISLACEQPAKSCFCTSLGGSPVGTEGADLLLTPLSDVYHVQVITERGRALVEEYGQFLQEGDERWEHERDRVEAELRQRVTKKVDIEGLSEVLEFDSSLWKTLTQQCIDCGICTFLCPTCHCFDIQDEGNPDGGARVRLWDSCAFREFTKMSVAQPRPTHYRRYRQRIMHKFRYYPENFGRTLCVGCGRCIAYCPVGVDLTEVLNRVRGEKSHGEHVSAPPDDRRGNHPGDA